MKRIVKIRGLYYVQKFNLATGWRTWDAPGYYWWPTCYRQHWTGYKSLDDALEILKDFKAEVVYKDNIFSRIGNYILNNLKEALNSYE